MEKNIDSETQEITTVSTEHPEQVVKTTKSVVEPSIKLEHPQKVFEKKKTIFRFYQVIWYILSIIEVLLGFRLVLKALGANPASGFTAFINNITDPLAVPFQGILGSSISGMNVIEWSTMIAAVVYALLAFGLVELLQFIKPVTKEEVEESVDTQ